MKNFSGEFKKAKKFLLSVSKKEGYDKRILLKKNNCFVCDVNPKQIFLHKILYKNAHYVNFPVYLCPNCGMAQQLFKFDNKFHNFYYKKIISKNLKITPQILKNNFFLSYKRGEFIFRKFQKYFQKRKMNILDLGSGTGGLLKYFQNKGHEVYGIEPNYEYFKYSKKILKNVINKNFEDYKYKKNFFDMVLIIGTLEHVNNPKKTIKMVNEITKKKSLMIVDSKGYPNDILKNYPLDNDHHEYLIYLFKYLLVESKKRKSCNYVLDKLITALKYD